MQIVKLPISELETNIGQIPDLPMNPRQWTKEQVETLAKSLRETPELFEARPVLVVPYGGKYVILGGNMRYEASKSNGEAEVPAIVFPADMPVAKMKEIVVKDNGSFGAWDWDALANEWDDLPLGDWGVPNWGHDTVDVGDLGIEPVASAGESLSGFTQMTFLFSKDDAEIVQGYIDTFGKDKLVEQIVEVCRTAEAK